MLSGFLFFLLRSKNKQIKKASNGEEEHSPKSSIEHYFKTEMKLTQNRFDLFYKDEHFQEGILAEPDWLRLRKITVAHQLHRFYLGFQNLFLGDGITF